MLFVLKKGTPTPKLYRVGKKADPRLRELAPVPDEWMTRDHAT